MNEEIKKLWAVSSALNCFLSEEFDVNTEEIVPGGPEILERFINERIPEDQFDAIEEDLKNYVIEMFKEKAEELVEKVKALLEE